MATRGPAAPAVEQTYARARALCQQVGEDTPALLTLRGLCNFYLDQGGVANGAGARGTARAPGRTRANTDVSPGSACRPRAYLVRPGRLHHHPDAPGTGHCPSLTRRRSGPRRSARVRRRGCGVWRWQPARCGAWAIRCRPCGGVRRRWALAQALDHPYSLGNARQWTAYLHHHLRDAAAVQALAEVHLAVATAQGFPLQVGLGTCWRGWALAMQGAGEMGQTLSPPRVWPPSLATGQRSGSGPSVWSCSPRRRGTWPGRERGCACWPGLWR